MMKTRDLVELIDHHLKYRQRRFQQGGSHLLLVELIDEHHPLRAPAWRGPAASHEMPALCFDKLRVLANQQVARAKDLGGGLMLFDLDWHAPHCRPRCRFAGGLGIHRVILLALHERLHIGGKNLSYIMTEINPLASPY